MRESARCSERQERNADNVGSKDMHSTIVAFETAYNILNSFRHPSFEFRSLLTGRCLCVLCELLESSPKIALLCFYTFTS